MLANSLILEKASIDLKNLVLFSDFDSGNLAAATSKIRIDCPKNVLDVNLTISNDCMKTMFENRNSKWFYFGVTVVEAIPVTFTISNSESIKALLASGHRIVWKSRSTDWQRLSTPCHSFKPLSNNTCQYSFDFDFTKYEKDQQSEKSGKLQFFFAFNYPWSYEENVRWINSITQKEYSKDVIVKKETLCMSAGGREVNSILLKTEDESPKRRVIVVIARLQPNETTSSLLVKAFVEKLLMNERFKPLVEKFTFIVVPMTNPDGVFRGFNKSNASGHNYNTCFASPSMLEQPEVYHICSLLSSYSEQGLLETILILRGTDTKEGLFVFGNFMEDLWVF